MVPTKEFSRGPGNTKPKSIVAYYLQTDPRPPLNPARTDVSFAIETGGDECAREQ
jgi:hypothetical protein